MLVQLFAATFVENECNKTCPIDVVKL